MPKIYWIDLPEFFSQWWDLAIYGKITQCLTSLMSVWEIQVQIFVEGHVKNQVWPFGKVLSVTCHTSIREPYRLRHQQGLKSGSLEEDIHVAGMTMLD